MGELGKTFIFGCEVAAAALLAWWIGMPNAIRLLVALQIADVVMGLVAAKKRSEIRSALAWAGWAKKIAAWVVVFVVYRFQVDGSGVVTGGAPIDNMALVRVAAIGFAVAEAISIAENAQRAGLWIPKFLTDGLAQTKELIFGNNNDDG